MEYIYNSDNIELSLKEVNKGVDLYLTLNDKYGHFDKEIKIENRQAYDLLIALKSIENRIKKNEFD